MARKKKRATKTSVLALRLWEELARDKNCAYSLRVFCVNAIAVATDVIEMDLVLPGSRPRSPKGFVDPEVAPQVEEPVDDNAEALKMLEELNAPNPESDTRADEGVR